MLELPALFGDCPYLFLVVHFFHRTHHPTQYVSSVRRSAGLLFPGQQENPSGEAAVLSPALQPHTWPVRR